MQQVNFTKEEIDDFNNKAITCYGETVEQLVIALQDGCSSACSIRKKVKRLFLIMYAFASIEMDVNGMTENNAVDPEGLANMVSYIQQNCNCNC